MKKKIFLVVALLGLSVIIFASLRNSEPPKMAVIGKVDNTISAKAIDFAKETFKIAKKSNPRDFGQKCHDVGDPFLVESYGLIRATEIDEFAEWTVDKLQDEAFPQYRVHLTCLTGKKYVCTLVMDDKTSDWKFVGFFENF